MFATTARPFFDPALPDRQPQGTTRVFRDGASFAAVSRVGMSTVAQDRDERGPGLCGAVRDQGARSAPEAKFEIW